MEELLRCTCTARATSGCMRFPLVACDLLKKELHLLLVNAMLELL